MSDLRDQLRKAGLVNDKQLRAAKHQDRLHRQEVGHQGLQSERTEAEEAFRRRQEEQKRLDREHEEARRQEQAERQRIDALRTRVRGGWLREATSGARRFYFVVDGGRITYLDLSDGAIRRLSGGSAAIVETRGAVRGEFCVVDGNAAQALAREHPEIIRFWNRAPAR